MTLETILKKTIEKAVRNGWKELPEFNKVSESTRIKATKFYLPDFADYAYLIFSHDFAEAFWGEEEICYHKNKRECPLMLGYKCLDCKTWLPYGINAPKIIKEGWQYYQHKMLDEVQAGRNPLKYLEKFL